LIPRDEMPPVARALCVLAITAALVGILWSACGAPSDRADPREGYPSAMTWEQYVRENPRMRSLDPDHAHPGWVGRGRCVCGAGKCE